MAAFCWCMRGFGMATLFYTRSTIRCFCVLKREAELINLILLKTMTTFSRNSGYGDNQLYSCLRACKGRSGLVLNFFKDLAENFCFCMHACITEGLNGSIEFPSRQRSVFRLFHVAHTTIHQCQTSQRASIEIGFL